MEHLNSNGRGKSAGVCKEERSGERLEQLSQEKAMLPLARKMMRIPCPVCWSHYPEGTPRKRSNLHPDEPCRVCNGNGWVDEVEKPTVLVQEPRKNTPWFLQPRKKK